MQAILQLFTKDASAIVKFFTEMERGTQIGCKIITILRLLFGK